jgi:hypothetical protein
VSGLAREVLDALVASLDEGKLEARLRASPSLQSAHKPAPAAPPANARENAALARVAMSDLLDDSILAARPSDKSFPLRVLLGEVTGALAESDEALTFAAGLNFYFRAKIEEDVKALLGVEVSRAYYDFAKAKGLEPELVAKASPLLAALLSTELERMRLEAVDAGSVFDSQLHERDRGASSGSSRIARPVSFLGRVVANGNVRYKARVLT